MDLQNLTEYFELQDEEILINEAYDSFMDAIELLKSKEIKAKAYNLLANRQYLECFDYLWKNGIPEVSFASKLGWGLRNFYAYKNKQNM